MNPSATRIVHTRATTENGSYSADSDRGSCPRTRPDPRSRLIALPVTQIHGPGDAGLRRQAHHTPEACEEGDVARLREAGFSDTDVLHIVEVTAIFNYNVRLATATGLFPNPEYHALGRTSAREG